MKFNNVTTCDTDHVQVKNEIVRNTDRKRLQYCSSLVADDVKTLLDVGTKTGLFCKLMQENGVVVHGLDDTLRSNMEPGIKFTQGDIRSLPFPDNSFDCVTAFEILEHLTFPDCERAVAELKRVAVRQVIISVPFREYPIVEPNHLQNFTERKLARLLDARPCWHWWGEVRNSQPLWLRVTNRCRTVFGLGGYRLRLTKARWLLAVVDLH